MYDAYRQSQSGDSERMSEFFEIMKMVGMTKPLHVRRLEKVLREWGANPGRFIRSVFSVSPSTLLVRARRDSLSKSF